MCRSVPQIDAARTRTSTSSGPIVGMGTFSSCAPCCGSVLRNAFIVAVTIRNLVRSGEAPSGLLGQPAMVTHAPAAGKLRRPPSFSARHDADGFQRLQIFNDGVERHGTKLRRD